MCRIAPVNVDAPEAESCGDDLTGSFRATRGEVHVWCASLALAPLPAELGWPLSFAERERAERLRFERDRRRFVAARTILRKLLGRYLECDPGLVRLEYGLAGKPRIAPAAPRFSGLEFNLSHSEDLALYALTLGCPVGVDVERVREIPDAADLAARHFSPLERAELRGATESEIPLIFFQGWTRKEARLKARGLGLGGGAAEEEDQTDGVSGWTMADLWPAPGYVGALAVQGTGCRILRRWWNPDW